MCFLHTQAARGLEDIPGQIDLNLETQFTVRLPGNPTSVSAELRCIADNSVTVCRVKGCEGGSSVISVTPAVRGKHELTIVCDGTAVRGCPVRVFVGCDPRELRRPVRVIEGLSRPAGVALRGDTEVVVTETEPAAVCIRDQEGKVVKLFQQGSPPLDNPYGVAVDSEGCVYVAEIIECRVHKFSGDGAHLMSVGGAEGVAFPAGINVSRDDKVYICDDTNNKVHVFNKNLEKLFSFGESGSAPGNLQSPSDVGFDSDGSVCVADTKRERIVKFSPGGEFISEFKLKDQGSELELGVCVGPSGHFFVSDLWNHCVVVFDRNGQFVASFGKKGVELGEFNMPAGIAVDEDGYVYVCDQLNCRIQVF